MQCNHLIINASKQIISYPFRSYSCVVDFCIWNQKNLSATKSFVWLIQTEDTKPVFLLLETNSNLDERKHYNYLIYSSIWLKDYLLISNNCGFWSHHVNVPIFNCFIVRNFLLKKTDLRTVTVLTWNMQVQNLSSWYFNNFSKKHYKG